MSLFSRFFRKAAPVKTVAAPIATRESRLAQDENSRAAAIQTLPDGPMLRRTAGLSDGAADAATPATPASAAAQKAAQSRLAQLVDDGTVDLGTWPEGAANRMVLFSVAALCKDPAHLRRAAAAIDDLQAAQLVVESPSSRVRQSAAEVIEDPEQLRQLLRQVRNKDKNVYKILKQKCDALNAVDRRAAEIAADISALCASLERHARRTYDAMYPSVFEQLENRWRSLTTQPDAVVEQRAEQAIDRCKEVIAAHQRLIAQQAADRAAAEAAQRAADELRESAQWAAQQAATALSDAESAARQEAAVLRAAEERAHAEKRAAEDSFFRQIGGLIRKANGALGDGSTQRAAGLRRAIDEKLTDAPVLPLYLTRQLQQLDEKLNELKEWKDYAVAPKRIELIEEMESLIGSTEEPKSLADRIKALQDEWRTISKGIVSEAPEDWERFHQASQAAYQPCRVYFETQAKLRQANLEKRRVLLERLAAFETAQNVDNPNWRLVASVLREAAQEWRHYFPVDRDAGRTLQDTFDATMGRLRAKLEAWYGHNVEQKQSLITRARHLLSAEDSREAIEAMKRLQIAWKETGMTPRDQDQALWNEFRELCDAVYQKRQQAYAEYAAGLEASKASAVALCEQAERVAALSGTALLDEAAQMPEWRSAFDALDEMPRSDARGLHDRFERALERCAAAVALQHERDAEQSFQHLIEAARRVYAYQCAVAQNADSGECETLKQSAESYIAQVPRWPKAGLAAVKEALATPLSWSDADREARERALRLLCIRLEIDSDIPSPPEDESLRREYQVARLMQAMGQGVHDAERDWDAIALEWIRIGGVSSELHERLLERLTSCRAKRPARAPLRTSFHGDYPEDRGGRENRPGQTRRQDRGGSRFANAR